MASLINFLQKLDIKCKSKFRLKLRLLIVRDEKLQKGSLQPIKISLQLICLVLSAIMNQSQVESEIADS